MEEAPSSPTSLLHLVPSTAQQIQFFSSGIINEVKNGNESPLRVLIQLRAMAKAAEDILKAIKDEIITEAEKYPGKDFTLWGNLLSKEDVYTSYDYSRTGDTTWEMLDADFKTAKRKLDERQNFLRSLKDPMTVVDEITGEIITIRPPIKKSTPGVKVFIK